MSINEIPMTPKPTSGGPLERLVMHGLPAKSKKTAENMSPEWLTDRLHYLVDEAMSAKDAGRIRRVKSHIYKMDELGITVPADIRRIYS